MKTTNVKMGLLAVVFSLGFATISTAQSRDRKPKTQPTYSELLEEMDSGMDGKLSAAEVKGPLKEMFGDIDTNEDGYITQEEFENAPKPKGRKPEGRN
ncbi:EF-hand domain-containing protein [Aureisphaera sp. CAU 1614]|uniref:EF-hand domain-containing protein n=1 Tax=Halomarinibacterium sedimenti TaxID=2857106 RepID=A0A9X1FMK0_9FLAO|nr:EF-hand domain-containing protein [Halomarinibacterium sedimenti]MBW2937408.1 EF-hand domain-containing protein [Halomarinibacterium sedimenti]